MKSNTCRSSGWVGGSLVAAMLVMGTGSMATAAGFTAYNDLAWGTGQLETNITKITSPNGGSGLPATGFLKDFATGLDTGVTLTVTGGLFLGDAQATQGANPATGDAFTIFDGKVSGQGVLSYNDVMVNDPVVLTFSGLDPNSKYDLAYFGHRNNNAWDRASLVTLSGSGGSRINMSSVASDNPSEAGGVIFSGVGDNSTRLPADNDNGYVARWSEVNSGGDGIVVLTISWDGTAGNEFLGKYGSAVRLIESSSSSAGHDLDGDGKADLVWRHTNGNAAVWLLNGTAVPSSMGSLGGLSSAWQVAGVGDTDADGKVDIIWRNTTSGAVAVWLMNGVTMTSAGFPGSASTAWQIQGVGDLNGDGKADLVWRHTNGSAAVWLLNGTAAPSSTGSLGVVSSAYQISGVGDTDGDGNADIIWRNTTSGVVAVWLMNGVTLTSAGFPGAVSTAWSIQGVGDLNGDGKSDLVWRHTNGSAAVWLLNGTGAPSSTGSLGVVSSVWQIRQVGDTDADGNADIIWRNTTSGAVAVWLMNGVTMTSAGFPGGASMSWEIQN